MISKGIEFLVSLAELCKKTSAKWRNVKLLLMTSTVVIFSIPVALLPSAFRSVQPTAEFVLLVVAPGLWNSVSTWFTAPCLYVLVNIVLVTLGLIYRAAPTSNDDRPENSGIISAETEVIETVPVADADADADHNNIIVESIVADPVENDFSPAASPCHVQKLAAAVVVEAAGGKSFKDLKNSRLRRSTTKLSNLSKECRESRDMAITESCTPAAHKTSPPPQLVVFEISTDHVEDYYTHQAHLDADDEVAMVEGDEECNILHREEEGIPLSSEELYTKAESFIGNFYRQLKMQREDSWNRLCGIYKRSC